MLTEQVKTHVNLLNPILNEHFYYEDTQYLSYLAEIILKKIAGKTRKLRRINLCGSGTQARFRSLRHHGFV